MFTVMDLIGERYWGKQLGKCYLRDIKTVCLFCRWVCWMEEICESKSSRINYGLFNETLKNYFEIINRIKIWRHMLWYHICIPIYTHRAKEGYQFIDFVSFTILSYIPYVSIVFKQQLLFTIRICIYFQKLVQTTKYAINIFVNA